MAKAQVPHLWAILARPAATQYEAARLFEACTGRRPGKMHYNRAGEHWWWMGWMTYQEAHRWESMRNEKGIPLDY